jgi:hypothetical protein
LRNREVILPAPGGPFEVGRVEYDWSDAGRADPLGKEPQQPRKLNVWIWYPGEPSPSSKAPAPYLPPAWIAAREQVSGIGTLLMQSYAHVRSHSTADLALSTAQASYPVLIMQPGLGPVIADYTTLAETLASYGYIVVGSTPTGSASVVVFNDGQVAIGTSQGNLPDSASPVEAQRILGSLIQVWAADDGFVLDQVEHLNAADPAGRFIGRIDLNKVGVIGHSFGGATAAEFCHLDSRCKAGVDLDGYLSGMSCRRGWASPSCSYGASPPIQMTRSGSSPGRMPSPFFNNCRLGASRPSSGEPAISTSLTMPWNLSQSCGISEILDRSTARMD